MVGLLLGPKVKHEAVDAPRELRDRIQGLGDAEVLGEDFQVDGPLHFPQYHRALAAALHIIMTI